jgi:arginine decarboxylase-like protein
MYTDDYNENGTTGVTLTVSDTGTELAISYATTSTGDDATIKYTISNFGV